MNTATRERPILFSAPMVRAILDGRKTQTRRVVKPQPRFDRLGLTAAGWARDECGRWCFPNAAPELRVHCPYGAPGDRLWVRETWAAFTTPSYECNESDEVDCSPAEMRREWLWLDRSNIVYSADEGNAPERWRPSIHMPRWASRITLEVTAVRVERLHAISEADAKAEGCESDIDIAGRLPHGAQLPTRLRNSRDEFRDLWDSINGERAPWSANPWVWVVEFERCSADEVRS